MSRRTKGASNLPNVPWITQDGYLDLSKFPIDSTLAQAVGDDEERFHEACRMLVSMVYAGRTEAAVFLYGLLRFCGDSRIKKESVVKALGAVATQQSADLLFEEFKRTGSSNSTRSYLTILLKVLRGFPSGLVRDGFEGLLADSRWSYKMRRKFATALEEMECRDGRCAANWSILPMEDTRFIEGDDGTQEQEAPLKRGT